MRFKTADRRLRAAVSLGVLLWLVALPSSVAAHSELETAVPADGAVVTGTPPEIVLTFSDALDSKKSSMTLHDATGVQLAKNGVDLADNTVMRLIPAALAAGTYEVRWTSAALDGDILRGTLQFTVVAPTPSPTSAPTATPSPSPSASPSPEPSASPSPSPSASPPPGPANASGGDVLLPIIAAIVVIGILGAMLLRGRSRGGGRA